MTKKLVEWNRKLVKLEEDGVEGQDRSGLPSKDGLLARERLNTLLEQGVKHMLVTVAAGPAYGKTQLVASFVRERRCRLAWQRIKRLDNLPSRFWRSVIRATTAELPVLAERLEELGYPDTVSKFDTFLRILADELYVGEEVICVVDDFHVLENPDIRRFFEYLVEANLENFCLILISGTKINLNVTGLRDIAFSITAEELKFTREEAEALFAMYNIALPPAQIEKIEKNVNGWPLALYLLALQLHEHPDRYDESIASSSFVVNQVFERECFSGYSDVVRKLLIKLSLIQGFSPEIVRTLAGDDAEAAFLELDQNTFILFDHVVRLHVFQNVYHKFLAEKQVCLTEEERREVYLTAARSFVEHGQTLEAIDCFEICGMYEEMLSAILAFTGTRMGMNVGHANYLLEKLDLLPEELVKSKPIVTYLRAFIYLNNVEVEKSLELFTELETRLQGDDA
ncbi:hypothetical protein LJC34_05420, partial [Oscillospiraceae bacterium OttesenSCG-928-G22]|nr:hypothetical protein [Oscillospiraceae bacterium OttesenSCG-928-G22]